ncbi:co-chaperone GroES [candidate division WOR-3 bacterium]|nr:co-chaperone GroES [candidate division WOR-3 bacterium]
MKIKPLGARVVVKRMEMETRTKAGIVIPDTAKEKPSVGEVLAVGPGKRNEKGEYQPLDVKVGDKIIFSKYAGTEIELEGEEYLILQEDEILGILES